MIENQLRPRLGLFSATMLVIGSIIGSGIFKKIAPMTVKLQSQNLVLLCWVAAGLITLMGALSYAEIASRLAQTGGLYAYLKSIYGRLTAYLFGWACFSVIQSASIASVAFVFAEASVRVFPQLSEMHVKWIAIATILLLTIINCLGLIFGAWLTNIFTVLKLLGIAAVTYFGFAYSTPMAQSAINNIQNTNTPNFSIPALFGAILGALWAFDGINNLGYIGGEIRNAKKIMPIALVLGVCAVLGTYLLVNISYFHALSLDSILEIAHKPGSVFAIEMIQKIRGSSWALFVSLLIMVSTFGTTNSSILTSCRIYYAMAKDGLFFPSLGLLHPRFKTPALALLAQGIWASALVAWGSFDLLTDMLIFASFIFYGLGVAGIFILRKKQHDIVDSDKIMRIPTAIPIIYILFCLTLVSVTLYQDTVQSLTGIGVIALGVPLYFLFFRKAK